MTDRPWIASREPLKFYLQGGGSLDFYIDGPERGKVVLEEPPLRILPLSMPPDELTEWT